MRPGRPPAPRPAPPRRSARVPAVLVATALAALTVGCSDDQPEWCASLARHEDLTTLVAAVAADDADAAADALDDLRGLAEDAPTEVRDDMDAVVAVLQEVVDLHLAGDEVPAAELERERDRVNQRLGDVTVHTAAVSGWAETECGLALD